MSCYEWESGQITFPAAEYLKVRNKMTALLNKQSEKSYEIALEVWTKVCAAGKGKRNFNWIRATTDLFYPITGHGEYDRDDIDKNLIMNALFKTENWQRVNKKPNKPQKKAFPKHAQTKLKSIPMGEASLEFCNKTKTIHWSVDENNRACERAREHPIASEFFGMLRYVTFTSRTGGYIIGNDEYNRDGGEGCNYVKDRFGAYDNPKSKKYREVSLYR